MPRNMQVLVTSGKIMNREMMFTKGSAKLTTEVSWRKVELGTLGSIEEEQFRCRRASYVQRSPQATIAVVFVLAVLAAVLMLAL